MQLQGVLSWRNGGVMHNITGTTPRCLHLLLQIQSKPTDIRNQQTELAVGTITMGSVTQSSCYHRTYQVFSQYSQRWKYLIINPSLRRLSNGRLSAVEPLDKRCRLGLLIMHGSAFNIWWLFYHFSSTMPIPTILNVALSLAVNDPLSDR